MTKTILGCLLLLLVISGCTEAPARNQSISWNSVSLDAIGVLDSFETATKEIQLDDFLVKKTIKSIELSKRKQEATPNYILFKKLTKEGPFIIERLSGNRLVIGETEFVTGDEITKALTRFPQMRSSEDSLDTRSYLLSQDDFEIEFIVSRDDPPTISYITIKRLL